MEFTYTARDKNGRRLSRQAKADSASLLVSQLKEEGLLPLEIKEIKTTSQKNGAIKTSRLLQKKIKLNELAVFTRQLAASINSGLVLTESLETINADLENRYLHSVVAAVLNHVRAGSSFSGALAKYSRVFPISYTAMIKAGEEGGSLGRTLNDLAKYLEDMLRLSQKIKSAIYYPVFLVGFCLAVVSAIIFFIVPRFKEIYEQAGVQLPLFTRAVIGFSEGALKNIHLIFLSVILFFFLFFLILKVPKAKLVFDRFKLRLLILGKLIKKDMLTRFCRTLSILLSGGVGLPSALPISSQVTNNLYLKQTVEQIRSSVIAGDSLSQAFKDQKFFPAMVVKMVQVGERSGKLSDMFMRNAEYYDRELETAINAYTSLIEPILIIFIGIIVAIVVVAFYLPIFRVTELIR